MAVAAALGARAEAGVIADCYGECVKACSCVYEFWFGLVGCGAGCRLCSNGFTGNNSLALISMCRDEITRPFVDAADQLWGNSFSIASLAGAYCAHRFCSLRLGGSWSCALWCTVGLNRTRN